MTRRLFLGLIPCLTLIGWTVKEPYLTIGGKPITCGGKPLTLGVTKWR